MIFPVLSAALVIVGLIHPTFAKEPLPVSTDRVSVELAAPPLEGTVSIGVFDAMGTCIRVLAKNADQSRIPSALNGFLVTWDGKTDAGTTAPAGEYEIRGATVGEVRVAGEAYHFNDWIDADRPGDVPEKTLRIEFTDGGFQVWQTFRDGIRLSRFDEKGRLTSRETAPADLPARDLTSLKVKDRREIYAETQGVANRIDLPELGEIVDLAVGREGFFWIIVRDVATSSTQLREYSLGGDFIRELDPEAGEAFEQIAASADDGRIALISQTASGERVRLLMQSAATGNTGAMATTGEALSFWKTTVEKRIEPCEEFGIDPVSGKVAARGNLPPEPFLRVGLVENPLFPGKKAAIELLPAGFDGGVWLTTRHGLPILQIAPDLVSQRLVLLRAAKNGAGRIYVGIAGAVAEFSVWGLENIMQFTSDKISWPPGPRQTADEQDVPAHEPAATPE